MKDSLKTKNLSLLFSKHFVSRFADKVDDSVDSFIQIMKESEMYPYVKGKSVSDAYESAFQELKSSYRSEYVYKNAIAEKIIRGRHRLSQSCYFSTEFPVGASIADVVVANGVTTAYEIKTEYDSFERLPGQVLDYQAVFDRVYVVVPESKVGAAIQCVDKNVGVIALTNRYTFSEEKEASSNVELLDKNRVFDCFRRNEYISLTEKIFSLPEVKPVELKYACKELFMQLSNAEVKREFLNALKSRKRGNAMQALLHTVPSSLLSVLLTADFSKNKVDKFSEAMKCRVV